MNSINIKNSSSTLNNSDIFSNDVYINSTPSVNPVLKNWFGQEVVPGPW